MKLPQEDKILTYSEMASLYMYPEDKIPHFVSLQHIAQHKTIATYQAFSHWEGRYILDMVVREDHFKNYILRRRKITYKGGGV